MIIDPVVADRLLDAWDRHGSLGPAFAEVYEQVTGVVDALEAALRPGWKPNAVLQLVKLWPDLDLPNERRHLVWDMRAAGLSLAAIGRLVDEDALALAALAHNTPLGDAPRWLELDELMHTERFTAGELSELSGVPTKSVYLTTQKLRYGRRSSRGRQ